MKTKMENGVEVSEKVYKILEQKNIDVNEAVLELLRFLKGKDLNFQRDDE